MATTITNLNEKYGFLLPNSGNTAPNNKISTPRQHTFYLDLCKQKRQVPVEDYEAMSFNTLSTLIDELKELKPVSDKQLESINSSIKRLAQVGIHVDVKVDELTGGREGTASATLEYLFELVNKHCPPEIMPPSDKQIEYVASMYLCPSVDFETHQIERWVYLENGFKRRPTQEEFIATIKAKFNRSTISDFINKNRAEFNEWRNTRIRPGQLKHILSLLDKHGGSQVDELTLLQFSQEEADAYIKQLLDEIKVPVPSSIINDHRDLPIRITSVQQAVEVEEKSLKDIFFGLQAETGYEIDDIEAFLSNINEVREYLACLVEEEYIAGERLIEIINENSILADMLEIK